MPCHTGKSQVLVRRQRKERGKSLVQNFTGISVGKIRQGRVNNLVLASMNTVGGLWAVEVVSS